MVSQPLKKLILTSPTVASRQLTARTASARPASATAKRPDAAFLNVSWKATAKKTNAQIQTITIKLYLH